MAPVRRQRKRPHKGQLGNAKCNATQTHVNQVRNQKPCKEQQQRLRKLTAMLTLRVGQPVPKTYSAGVFYADCK